ncbi:hypothetical protein MMC10_001736 [Thelotrema lepadinum]|nr:hypothetical protein [Thelotrema lepadinum]
MRFSAVSAVSALAIVAPFAIAAPTPITTPNPAAAAITDADSSTAAGGVGSMIIQNHCSWSISLSSVGSSPGPVVDVAAGKSYSEQFHTTSTKAGVSIKIVKDGNPLAASNITQVEYTLVGPLVYYDLSLINGDAFAGEHNAIVPATSSCPQVTCAAGEVPCKEAYTSPPQPKTKACTSSGNIVYNICN